MTSTTSKNYTIKDLMERYHIKTRQTVYDWCNAADISFSKDTRNRSVVSEAQLAILDQLQEHLQNDGLLAGFTPISTTQLNTSPDTPTDSIVDTTIDTALDKVPPSSLDSDMETV